jgi:hypothetical protein
VYLPSQNLQANVFTPLDKFQMEVDAPAMRFCQSEFRRVKLPATTNGMCRRDTTVQHICLHWR